MTSLFVPLWEESCKLRNRQKLLHRLMNWNPKFWNFSINFFWKENFSVVEFPSVDVSARGGGGCTQLGVHGHMVAIWKGNPLLEYCYLRRQKVENVMHGAVYFTIHSLPYDLFIHGRLRLVKFARYSVVPPKTPQASKLPVTILPVDWSVCTRKASRHCRADQ